MKSEKYLEPRNKYLQLKKRRRYKKAIIAIARLLLTAIYHVLLKSEPYDLSYYLIEVVQPNRVMTINEAVSSVRITGLLSLKKIFEIKSLFGILFRKKLIVKTLKVYFHAYSSHLVR